jgi:hypothetical protein
MGRILYDGVMIKLRHQQPSLWNRGLAEDIADLWEPWMRLVDDVLEDEQLLDTVYETQGSAILISIHVFQESENELFFSSAGRPILEQA